jgi:hypothetical protein
MRRGFSSLARLAFSLLLPLALGCGPMNDFGYVRDIEIPANTGQPVVIRVGGGGERHPIRLSWPAEVGRRGRTHVEVDETRSTTVRRGNTDGDAKTEHKRTVADGTAVTLAVDENGAVTKADLLLDALDAEGWSLEPKVHLANVKVHVERARSEADAIVTVDGHDVASGSERDAIDELITLKISDLPSDDEAFGTSDLIAIGARWPMRGEVVRRALTEEELRIPEGAVSGDMMLRGLVDRGGVACLDVTGTLDVQTFEVSSLPPEAHIEHAALHVVTHLVVPTAPGPRFEDDMTISTEIAMATPDGGLIESHSTRKSTRSYAPVD